MVSTPVPPIPPTRMLYPFSSNGTIRGSGSAAIIRSRSPESAAARTGIVAPVTVTKEGQNPFAQL